MARAEEEALDDPRQLHVRRAVLRQVGEEAAQALVVLAEAAVDDDQAEVVLGVEQVVEALGEEHQPGRVDVLRAAEEVGLALGAELEVEQRHVRGERRAGERREDGVGERGAAPRPCGSRAT